ncbi:MAG: UbiD family decarboxylase [Acidobacteria bacterium]|nr:UbiD family decarboxylase [Acidobacteriota bacterium]
MFPDLRTFMDRLRADADLVTITAPVDAHLEAAEIHRRVIAAGGPALLFTNVKGRGYPLVTNLFGTERRATLAFGEHPMRFIRRLVDLAQTIMPPDAAKLWGARDIAGSLLKVGLKRQSLGPVTEVVTRDPRLDTLPALTCWPDDGGPFVTLPLVYTEHPGGHGHNLAMYRLHVHDANSTGMHWQIGKGGGFHYQLAEAKGQALPVTVFLGGPPALILSAIAPLPENVPELMLASLIAGERLARVPGPYRHPHPLVANAEFALMGEVRPHERQPEGPFGDHYGYYSLRHDYPVFRVHTLAHRRDAIYPATVVGKPRQEDFFIGDLLQELLSPLFPLVMPAVEQLWSYGETGYHSLAAAVVKQRYPREAMASAFRILGEGQLSLQKFLLLTDRHVDVKDFRATLEHVLARTDPRTDLYVFGHLSMDTLDYAGPAVNKGSKGVWMGLGDPIRDLPREFRPPVPPPADVTDVRVFCGGCLVVGARPFAEDRDAAARLAAHPAFVGWPLLVVSDEPERATRSAVNFLWTTFTRFEPAADIHASRVTLERNHVVFTPPVAIDARMKPWYPAEVSCDPETADLVTRRWREYFPYGKVVMGDAERGHLD